jgi:glycerophosphoryl diester phosphodiesterase
MTVVIIIPLVLIVLFLLWVLALRCRKNHPALKTLRQFRYAHRGLHNSAAGVPENSMAAFRLAAEHGYGIELDVHLSKDGRLVVIHDNSLLRTAGVDVKAKDLTAEELGEYRLEGTEEKIPFLEEVLPLFEGKAPLIVELKVEGNAADLAHAACTLLDQYKVDYCIESFHPQAISWLKKNRPEICRGQLSQNFIRHEEGTGLGKAADFAMTYLLTSFLTVPDFIAYNHKHRDNISLQMAKAFWQVQEVSWTLRTPEDMEECEASDSLSIFENFAP